MVPNYNRVKLRGTTKTLEISIWIHGSIVLGFVPWSILMTINSSPILVDSCHPYGWQPRKVMRMQVFTKILSKFWKWILNDLEYNGVFRRESVQWRYYYRYGNFKCFMAKILKYLKFSDLSITWYTSICSIMWNRKIRWDIDIHTRCHIKHRCRIVVWKKVFLFSGMLQIRGNTRQLFLFLGVLVIGGIHDNTNYWQSAAVTR